MKIFFRTNPMNLCYNSPNPIIRLIEGRKKKLIVSEVNKIKGSRIVDIGCEASHILFSLETENRDRIGLDIAINALSEAKKQRE